MHAPQKQANTKHIVCTNSVKSHCKFYCTSDKLICSRCAAGLVMFQNSVLWLAILDLVACHQYRLLVWCCLVFHDVVINWKHFLRYWNFVWGIHRSPVSSHHKGQWRGVMLFLWSELWKNGWVNNREAGDLRRHRAHYDVILIFVASIRARLWWMGFNRWSHCHENDRRSSTHLSSQSLLVNFTLGRTGGICGQLSSQSSRN